MSDTELIQDLYQSIKDDLNTLESMVADLQLTDIELFHYTTIHGILRELSGDRVPDLLEFRKVSRRLQNQFLYIRRDGLRESNLTELLKYFDRLKNYLDSIEALSFQDPEKSIGDEKFILVIEASDAQRRLIASALPENSLVEFEGDGIHALDRFIHMPYDIVILATGVEGIDSRSLLKAFKVVNSVNEDYTSIFITSGNELGVDAQFAPDHHIVRNKNLAKNIEQYI